MRKRVERAGGEWLMGEPEVKGGSFYEVKFHDPNRVIFDLLHNGWGGAQRKPGEADNEVTPARTLAPASPSGGAKPRRRWRSS
jgi:hypothetical protein